MKRVLNASALLARVNQEPEPTDECDRTKTIRDEGASVLPGASLSTPIPVD
ncbi:MAG: hypothetical protein AAGA75_04505 [Cyanobacteria bacterium P01_E01_bin.6]